MIIKRIKRHYGYNDFLKLDSNQILEIHHYNQDKENIVWITNTNDLIKSCDSFELITELVANVYDTNIDKIRYFSQALYEKKNFKIRLY